APERAVAVGEAGLAARAGATDAAAAVDVGLGAALHAVHAARAEAVLATVGEALVGIGASRAGRAAGAVAAAVHTDLVAVHHAVGALHRQADVANADVRRAVARKHARIAVAAGRAGPAAAVDVRLTAVAHAVHAGAGLAEAAGARCSGVGAVRVAHAHAAVRALRAAAPAAVTVGLVAVLHAVAAARSDANLRGSDAHVAGAVGIA